MLLLQEPSEDVIRQFLDSQQSLPFTYPEIGDSREKAPAGYAINHHRRKLGQGPDAFARAVAALHQWKMYGMNWTKLYWPDTPITAGATVGVLAYHFGFWSLNASRIVYVLDEGGALRRHGFAIGTLPEHVESGEERFTIEWNHDDDSVWYEIFSFIRPHHFLAKIGRPMMWWILKRFALDSQQAMICAVNQPHKN